MAGDQLNLLAAQDSDYSLYDYEKKGSFGAKKTRRDEVTDVRNIGSEIRTGADLLLVSGADQHYQAAKLDSGNDLTSHAGEGGKDENGWSVEGWNYEKDRQQIVRATVGEGDVVVRDDVATGMDSTSGLNRDIAKAHEITRDEEHTTDLYVSESSLKAVANPKATLKQWQDNVERYGENGEQAIEKLIDAFLVTRYCFTRRIRRCYRHREQIPGLKRDPSSAV